MKNLKYIILTVFILSAVGCTKDFEDINTNPNAPTETNPGGLLSSIIFEPLNSHLDLQTWLTNQAMHYTVWRNENNLDRYDIASGDGFFSEYWKNTYRALIDYNDLAANASEPEFAAYASVAKILRAFYMATATELWIDVPFTQAGLGLDNLQPAYDSQQEIYTQILQDLKDANSELSATSSFPQGGDVLFGGDAMMWKRMANSLRLRYLLRLSNREQVNATSEINAIFADPMTYPIITSNSEAAIYDFSGIAPNTSNFSNSAGSINVSERLVATLDGADNINNNEDDDPRLAFWAQLPDCNSNPVPDPLCTGQYLGAPNGVSREVAQGTGGNAELYSSDHSDYFRNEKGALDFVFISHSEVEFILAEAAMKGWITSDAQAHYEAGIQSNLDYWGIATPADFYSRTDVAWDNTMETLMNQKWIAFLWNNTIEMWGEYKRTALPDLTTTLGEVATSVTGGEIITRVFYPTLEQSVNSANYSSASGGFGSDNAAKITAKHWYQD